MVTLQTPLTEVTRNKGISMKNIPPVRKYMTMTPIAINADSTVEEAMKVMQKHDIRHLPVVSGTTYGVISDRDLKYASALAGFNPRHAKVRDIWEEQPYITKPDALISDVSAELAERKVGSVLVMDNGHLVGILTTTDVCRALNDVCSNRWSH